MRNFTMFVLLATCAVPAMAAGDQEGGRHWRQQQQSEQSDNRPAREARAERPQREEQRQQLQGERQAQLQQMQAARQAQVQQVQQQQQQQGQTERHNAERNRMFAGRGSSDQNGQASRDERMQQYRQQLEQRRAQTGGQTQVLTGQQAAREGHFRTSPVFGRNAGRPAPENRDARFAHRDDRRTQWTSNWRTDNRYDWRRYRDRHHSIFHIGFYYDPFGYSYNRFNIGSFLYPSYYQSNYWINDPWQYRLPPAYGPYRWIRYHNDALMIDTWTGEVVDVIYGFFW